MKVGTSGYGSEPSTVDTFVSDGSGHFHFSNEPCSSANEVWYVAATGGNAGAGINSHLGMLAMLGPCKEAPSTLTVNELTTVATIYAMSQFMDPTQLEHSFYIGTSSTNMLGLVNAAATVSNLVDVTTGTTPGPALPSGATNPTSEINTLANIIASCVVLSDTNPSTLCTQLDCYATPGGAWNGTTCTPPSPAAADTRGVILQITRSPANNISQLFSFQSGSPPFVPALSTTPHDWTMGLKYSNGVTTTPPAEPSPFGLAIDGLGDVWVANFGAAAMTKLSPTGALLSPAGGFTGGGLAGGRGVAVDSLNNVWVANDTSTVSEFDSNGNPLSPSSGYTGGGQSGDYGIAVDASDRVWIANAGAATLSEFCGALPANCPAGFATGEPISPAAGFTGGGLQESFGVAVDNSNEVWVVGFMTGNPGALSEFNSSGTPISGSTGYTGGGLARPTWDALDTSNNIWASNLDGGPSGFSSNGTPLGFSPCTGGGAGNSEGIAVDAGNHVWVSNESSPVGTVSEFTNTCTALSPSGGFQGGGLNDPIGIAIDASGNVWMANDFDGTITQLLGAATPTKTPLIGLPVLP